MTSKHTPGPWFTLPYPYKDSDRIHIYSGYDGAPARGIGEVWDIHDHPQNEANARLIAMAPRMYEALRACRAHMYEHASHTEAFEALCACIDELETD